MSEITFNSIHNFRDLGSSSLKVQKGKIFRGVIYTSTEDDIQKITNEVGIKTVIDLRTSREVQPLKEQHFMNAYKSAQSLGSAEQRRRVSISLGVISIIKAMWSAGFYYYLLLFFFCVVLCMQKKAIYYVRKFLQEVRLFGLNLILIDHSKGKVKKVNKIMTVVNAPKVFQLLANSKAFPVCIQCSLSKDRTGLFCALLLDLLSVDRKDIIADYAKSKDGILPLKESIRKKLSGGGFGEDEWLYEAPPEIMEKTLKYIDNKYGSTESYLLHIGITKDEIRSIRANLSSYC